MGRYLQLSVLPGILILTAQCSVVDKAKSMATGTPAASSVAASAPAASSGSPAAVPAAAAASGATADAASSPSRLPPPEPSKNVLGVPYPAPSSQAQLMDEMSDDYPTVWVSTEYDKDNVVVWSPKVLVTVRLADAKRDDVLEIQHMEGKKKWGPVQKCTAQDAPWKTDGTTLIKFDCEAAKESKSKSAGDFSAVLTYVQTGAGKRQEAFATLQYKVIKFRGDAKPTNPDMKFAVDYDFHVGDAWIYPEIKASTIHPEYTHDPASPLPAVIHTWMKWEKAEPNEPVMRCYFGGKEIAETTGGAGRGMSYDSYKDAKSDAKQIGWSKYRFYLDKLVYALPLDPEARKNYAGNVWAMNEHPGDYVCKVTHKGEVIRVVNFGFKGNDVVRSECQKNLVTFSPTALISVSELKGDAPFAKDAYKKHAFFNRAPWPAGCPK